MTETELEELEQGRSKHRDDVMADQVRALYNNAPVANAAALLGVALLSPALLFDGDTQVPYIIWSLVMILAAAIRMSLVFAYRLFQPGVKQIPRWSMFYIGVTVLMGLAWASLGVLILPYSGPEADLFCMIILLGVMAAALPLLSMIKWALFAYILPSIVMLSLYFLDQGGMAGASRAAVFIVFFLLLVISSHRLQRTLWDSATLIYQKRDLIESLKKEHALLEAARSESKE